MPKLLRVVQVCFDPPELRALQTTSRTFPGVDVHCRIQTFPNVVAELNPPTAIREKPN
jgi:hypothetical protein